MDLPAIKHRLLRLHEARREELRCWTGLRSPAAAGPWKSEEKTPTVRRKKLGFLDVLMVDVLMF